jgi:hypothetical protein
MSQLHEPFPPASPTAVVSSSGHLLEINSFKTVWITEISMLLRVHWLCSVAEGGVFLSAIFKLMLLHAPTTPLIMFMRTLCGKKGDK